MDQACRAHDESENFEVDAFSEKFAFVTRRHCTLILNQKSNKRILILLILLAVSVVGFHFGSS
jgi:hypothetical protein